MAGWGGTRPGRARGRRRLTLVAAAVLVVAMVGAGGPAALARVSWGDLRAFVNVTTSTVPAPAPPTTNPTPPATVAPLVQEAPVRVTAPPTVVEPVAGPQPSTRADDPGAAAGRVFFTPLVPAGAITFSEFAVGTAITNQYQSRGVVFGGDSPFITTDGANPTSPVLSGSPRFQGEIRINVVDPATGGLTTTTGVQLDVGYIDSPNSVEVEYYGSDGRRFGAVRANARAINTLTIPVRGVSLLIVRAVENEPSGFAIDNVVIGIAPAPVKPTRMVAFGDSYTSGEGLRPGGFQYDCGTDLHKGTYYENSNARPFRFDAVPEGRSDFCDTVTQGPLPDDFRDRPLRTYENLCHRHAGAWPNDIRGRLGIGPGNGLFVACSGALTKHLGFRAETAVQYAQSPQSVAGGETQKKNAEDFKAAGPPVDFVTVGIGGNDAGFEAIITDCIKHACLNRAGAASSAVATINQTVYPNLVTTFQGIRNMFPNAAVLTYGYPSVVDKNRTRCVIGLGRDEVTWAQDTLLPALNQAVADAAATAGVTFMPLTDVTRGHEACDGDGSDPGWINALVPGDDKFPFLGNESFHPNQRGHTAIANHFVAHYTDGKGNLTFSNPPANPTIRPPSRPITLLYGAVNATPVGPCGAGCLQPACAPGFCELQVGVDNFSPFTPLTVTLNSEPVLLGQLVTDANGAGQGTFTVPNSVPEGEHFLEIEGVSPGGVGQLGNQRVYIKRLEPIAAVFEPPPCRTTLSGDVSGPFTVTNGDHLCFENARAVGPVTVHAGGALTATDSQITRGVVSSGASYIRMCGSALSQPGLTIIGSTGPVILGDPGEGCAGNRLIGATVKDNAAGVTMRGNTFAGQATFDGNTGGTNTVGGNTMLLGTLACAGNDPAPVNAGEPNAAPFGKTGQCAAL